MSGGGKFTVQMANADQPRRFWPLEEHLGEADHVTLGSAKREQGRVMGEMKAGFLLRVVSGRKVVAGPVESDDKEQS